MAHEHEGCRHCSQLNLLGIQAGHDSREHQVLHQIESETGLGIANPSLAKLLIDALAQYRIEDITEAVIFGVLGSLNS
jgi:hypothetical protein